MDKITMEDIMQWLEAQRTEVIFRLTALGDGDESHVEYSSDAKAVRIINAIVKRMGEMTAVEFLERWNEMCKNSVCETCPIAALPTAKYYQCGYVVCSNPGRAVEIVKKWKEEQDGNE